MSIGTRIEMKATGSIKLIVHISRMVNIFSENPLGSVSLLLNRQRTQGRGLSLEVELIAGVALWLSFHQALLRDVA